jgi:hypothetical protein
MPHWEGAVEGRHWRLGVRRRERNLSTVSDVLCLSPLQASHRQPWPVDARRGNTQAGGGGLHFSILCEKPVKGDRVMRRIKIVLVSGRCRRDDRHIGTCRQPAPHYLAWCQAAMPVTHAGGVRSIASQRKSLFPLGSRAVSVHLAALSAAGRERG